LYSKVKLKLITATGVAKNNTSAAISTGGKLSDNKINSRTKGIIIRRLIRANKKSLSNNLNLDKSSVPPRISKASGGAIAASELVETKIKLGSGIFKIKKMKPSKVAMLSGLVIIFNQIFLIEIFLRSNNSKFNTLSELKIGFDIDNNKKAVVTPTVPNKLVMIGIPIIKKFVRNIEWEITACVDISLLTRRELI
jgi:hypothetical protein